VSVLQAIAADLRQRRLWALAAALVVALIAVPVLLSSGSPSSGPSAQAPPARNGDAARGAAGAPASPAVPVVSVGAGGSAGLSGPARDPFVQRSSARPARSLAAVATPTPVAGTGGTAPSTPAHVAPAAGSSATSASGAPTAGSSRGTTAGGAAATSRRSTSMPARPAGGLNATQSYTVAIGFTGSGRDLPADGQARRLLVLPSAHDPLLVELGVLRGARRVLFALLPDTLVHGPGRCIPGRADCELLSLAPGEVEALGRRSPVGPQLVGYFAVGIGVRQYGSVAAADRARRAVSATGRRLLRRVSLPALALFPYDSRLGALLDLRDLVIRRG